MKKLLICLCVLLLFGLPAQAEEKRIDLPVGDSPVLGPPDAPITIVEFIDFQ